MTKINCALIGYGNVGKQHAYFLEKNIEQILSIYVQKSQK